MTERLYKPGNPPVSLVSDLAYLRKQEGGDIEAMYWYALSEGRHDLIRAMMWPYVRRNIARYLDAELFRRGNADAFDERHTLISVAGLETNGIYDGMDLDSVLLDVSTTDNPLVPTFTTRLRWTNEDACKVNNAFVHRVHMAWPGSWSFLKISPGGIRGYTDTQQPWAAARHNTLSAFEWAENLIPAEVGIGPGRNEKTTEILKWTWTLIGLCVGFNVSVPMWTDMMFVLCHAFLPYPPDTIDFSPLLPSLKEVAS